MLTKLNAIFISLLSLFILILKLEQWMGERVDLNEIKIQNQTPRIQVNMDEPRCERRDQQLLEQKRSEKDRRVQREKKTARRILQEAIKYRRFSGSCSHRNKNGLAADKMKIKLREVKLKADQPNKSPCLRREHRVEED